MLHETGHQSATKMEKNKNEGLNTRVDDVETFIGTIKKESPISKNRGESFHPIRYQIVAIFDVRGGLTRDVVQFCPNPRVASPPNE